MKLSLEEIQNLVKTKYNGEYEVLEERIIKTTKSQRRELKLKHTCGNTYWLQLYRVIGKTFQQCPFCNKKKSKITKENFKQKVFDLVGDEYDVIGEYINNYTKIKIRHNKCGSIIEMMPKHFLNDGHRCKSCAMKNRYKKSFIEDVMVMSDNKLHLIDEYSGIFNLVTLKCEECGSTFKIRPHDVYKQFQKYDEIHCILCYHHNMSIGEKHVMEILNKYNIEYIYNKSLPGCKYKAPLRFDFIIGGLNKPLACIEFDGDQHYDTSSLFCKNQFELDLIKTRDSIKNKYCEDNNIPLLRTREKSKLKLDKEIKQFLNENKLL